MPLQLSRFSVKIQIAAIGACAVAGVLVIGGIHASGQTSMARFKAAQTAANELREIATEMNVGLLEMRRSEKDFFLRREDRHAERHEKLVREFEADLPKFAGPLSRIPELSGLSPKISSVREGFQVYRKHFAQAVDLERKLGLTEAAGLEGALRTSVHAIEAKVGSADEAKLTNSVLMMRRHEKDFMLRSDPRYIAEMATRAKEFAKLLETSAITGRVFEDIKAGMAAYQRDFAAFADTRVALRAETKALSEAYATIDPVVDEIIKAVEKRYQDATSALQDADDLTSRSLWFALALTLAVVAAAAFLIGRAISKPLVELANVMGQVAKGDLGVRVDGGERGDEIGLMARALQVFKEALIAKKAADEAAASENAAKMRRAQRL
ncbi:HAMP domain-containing protein, partial [Salinarimonas soli]